MIIKITDPVLSALEKRIYSAFKTLLENKHLYQNIEVIFTNIKNEIMNQRKTNPEHFTEIEELIRNKWIIIDNSYLGIPFGEKREIFIQFHVPDVKLFCTKCDRSEAHNSIAATDFLQKGFGEYSIQVFVLSFLCQSCKSVPEVFIVRRDENKLQICGRSPIEHLEVPNVIPKDSKHLYSGALIAHQSGQTLAGIFLLRSLIEQWTRTITHSEYSKNIESILDEYNAKLPNDFVSRFPSFVKIYSDLSVDIHATKGDAELFEKTVEEITKHFEARKLFCL